MKISLISTSTYASDQGLRMISSYLKKNGYEVKIIFLTESEDYSRMYSRKVLRQLLGLVKNSGLIGIAAYASTARRASQVIRFLKSRVNIPIVYGGIHATISPEECINENEIVCVGEGEEAILELASAVKNKKDFSKIKNLWVRKENRIIKNNVRPLVENLDKYPYADYEINNHYILENNKIVKFQERHLNGYIFFLTGRGCPYSCTYCSNRLLNNLYKGQKPVRWHSPDYIINCILELRKKYKSLNVFDIRDDTFFIRSLEQIKEFCEKYKRKVGIRFKCFGDPHLISDEKIKLLVDAGCSDIVVGIQGQERINYEIYKRFQKDDDVLKSARILNRYKGKLAVMYDVITTNPYEKAEDVINLIKLLQKIPKPYYLSVNNLVFFSGSELYNKAKKDGVIREEKDSASQLNYWDRWKHIKLKKRNAYLNLVLNLMRGVATENRYGLMPAFVLRFLLKREIVRYNLRHKGATYFVGNIVQIMDFFRENIAKPVYRRALPVNIKIWYDRVRYRV